MNKPVFDNILNNLPEVLIDVDNNPLETIEKQILIAMGNGSSQNYIAKEVIKTPSSNNDRQNQQAFDNRLNTIRAKLGLVVGGDKSRYVIKALKMGYLRLSDFDVE